MESDSYDEFIFTIIFTFNIAHGLQYFIVKPTYLRAQSEMGYSFFITLIVIVSYPGQNL